MLSDIEKRIHNIKYAVNMLKDERYTRKDLIKYWEWELNSLIAIYEREKQEKEMEKETE